MKAVTTLGLHDALLSAGIERDKVNAVVQALENEMFESLVSKDEFRSEMLLCKQDFRSEILLAKQEFRSEIQACKQEIGRLEQKMDNGFADVRKDIVSSSDKQLLRIGAMMAATVLFAIPVLKALHIIL